MQDCRTRLGLFVGLIDLGEYKSRRGGEGGGGEEYEGEEEEGRWLGFVGHGWVVASAGGLAFLFRRMVFV